MKTKKRADDSEISFAHGSASSQSSALHLPWEKVSVLRRGYYNVAGNYGMVYYEELKLVYFVQLEFMLVYDIRLWC